jgi:ElaB/YqjD/DUF883 family membrane-anchored ribosome-binding protein
MTDTTTTAGVDEQQRTNPLSNLQSAARDAQAQLTQRAGQAREWAAAQTDVARQTVVERPFVSTGAAFAAGVIFGILLARR